MRSPPRSRATDAQRTAVWELLDAAYADGRLDPLEHLERTRAIPHSRYVDELRELIADLQGGPDDPGLGTPRTARGSSRRGRFTYEAGNGRQLAYLPPDREPRGPGRLRRRGPHIAAAALVLGVAAIIVSALLAPADDVPAPSPASGGSDTAAVTGADVGAHAATPEPLHTLDGMTRLLEAARADFGDHHIENLYVWGESAVLTHSAPDAPGTVEQHRFRGRWQPLDTPPPAPIDSSPSDRRTFGLASVEPAAVVAALADAPAQVGMVGAATSDVVIRQHPSHGLVYDVSVTSDDRLGRALYDPRGHLLESAPPR